MSTKIFFLILLCLFTLLTTNNTEKRNLSRSLVNYDYCNFYCGGHGQCYQVGKEVRTYYYRCLCDDGYCDEPDRGGHYYQTVYHPYYYKCTKKCVDILKSEIKDIIGIDPDFVNSTNVYSFFDFQYSNSKLDEIYKIYNQMKDFEEFIDHPVKKIIKEALGFVLDKTVDALIDDTPLEKFSGITDFFGFFIDIGIDFIFSSFRNLKEAQTEAETDLKKYVLINGDRAVKKIKKSKNKFSETDRFGESFYEVEIVSKKDVKFPGWKKKDINKCLDSIYFKDEKEFVHVKTKADGKYGKKLKNKCASRYYTKSLGFDLEDECADILDIKKKNILGSDSDYCYVIRYNISYFIYSIMFLILIF
jgi:hypothetical protein